MNAKALTNTDTWYGRLINQLIFPVIIGAIVLIMNMITGGRMLSGNGHPKCNNRNGYFIHMVDRA